MEEKKGFNFLVGIFSLWALFKLYQLGVLHAVGFLAVNHLTGSNLTYSSSDLMTTTPFGVAISFLIEAITVLGYLAILVSTGLWNLIVALSAQFNDLFKTLSVYLKQYTKKDTNVVQPDVTPSNPSVNVVDDKTMLFELLKDIKTRLNNLEQGNKSNEQA